MRSTATKTVHCFGPELSGFIAGVGRGTLLLKPTQRGNNPFPDVEGPYRWVVDLEENGKIQGAVFDSGCGAGHNSIYLASKGFMVTGVDISSKAIERARQKARDKGIVVDFVKANACELVGLDNKFDTVIDIGCFHSLL